MLFVVLFLSALACGLAEIVADSSNCPLQLQRIVSKPETYSYDYMRKVMARFRKGSAFLFTPKAQEYINDFQQQWGVSVTINTPNNVCSGGGSGDYRSVTCSSVSNDTRLTGNHQSFITINESGNLASLTVNITGRSQPTKAMMIGTNFVTLKSPSGKEITLLDDFCTADSEYYQFIISDSGIPFDCSTAVQGIPSQPVGDLSLLLGEPLQGTWTLTLFSDELLVDLYSWSMDFCPQENSPLCPSNVAQSLLNLPGFRVDSGMVYWTEDVFSSDGVMRQVTLSRSIDSMYGLNK